MDQRDQELLDKQLRRIAPPSRHDGVMFFAVLAVFLAGVTFGGLLAATRSGPTQIASNVATAANSLLNGAPASTRR
jgi:hypothetical protein